MPNALLDTKSSAPQQASGPVNADAKPLSWDSDADYEPLLGNWYTAKPYGFKLTDKGGNTLSMFLPISPSNLTITTNFATSIVPTLYGTVEEHSPVRYYDITIDGTTGMGPKYIEPFVEVAKAKKSAGRAAFAVKEVIRTTSAFGFFTKTLSRVKNVFNQADNILGSTSVTSGLKVSETGYAAFHNLYRLLLKYKKDASSPKISNTEAHHPLTFFNYKDNNQYKVVIRSFTLRRDKEDPMMYHYNIVMRGYDLETAGTKETETKADELLASLGLNGVDGSSFLGEAKKKAEQARNILGSVANGTNQLGR